MISVDAIFSLLQFESCFSRYYLLNLCYLPDLCSAVHCLQGAAQAQVLGHRVHVCQCFWFFLAFCRTQAQLRLQRSLA